MAPHQGFLSALVLFLIFTDSIASPVSNTTNNAISSQDAPKPSAKQGILEIPKNVATLIRKTLEYGLQNYLNLTTPRPDPYRPASISDSIIGHYLLGNVYPRPQTHAEPYQENKPVPTLPPTLFPTLTKTEPQPPPPQTPAPVKRKPLPSNVEKTPATKPEVQQPAPEAPTVPPTKPLPEEPLANAEPTAPKAPTKIHTLDTDSSISGIFNSNGLFLNNVDGEDVYYVGPTKGSIVFPIETSTQATTTPEPEPTTAEPTPASTSEAGDEDDDGEEGFEELEFNDVKKLNKIA